MEMTQEQEKRFNQDLEKVAGCKVINIVKWVGTNFSITVKDELGAYRIAHTYQRLPATIKYLEHMNAWNVRIGE